MVSNRIRGDLDLSDSRRKRRNENPAAVVQRNQDRAGCDGSISMTTQLTFVSPRKTTVNLGNGAISGPVISDNRITLRFRTKDFTGEFFHYTNDLFLIYHSGH